MQEIAKRGQGRPLQGKERKPHVDLTLDRELLMQIDALAKRDGTSRSQYIESVLRFHVETEERR